jgi:hypothetical protein
MNATSKSFTCPLCSTQTELKLAWPLVICCPSCGETFSIDETGVVTNKYLLKLNLQPLETIKLGCTGKYQGAKFEVIGKIRSRNTHCVSNEWLMKFEDGKEKWLVENSFFYFLLESEPIVLKPTALDKLDIGGVIEIEKNNYRLIDLSKQIKFRMDGQIPESAYNDQQYFKYEGVTFNHDSLISIVIFDKSTVEAYKGVNISLKELELSTLREFKEWN